MKWRHSMFFCALIMAVCAAGCIRLTGGTGVWYQGAEDEAPKSKQIGFDTDDLIPQKNPPGNIEIAQT